MITKTESRFEKRKETVSKQINRNKSWKRRRTTVK